MKKHISSIRIAALALTVCALFTAGFSCKKDTARWVVEKQGVRMREAPDTSGKQITVVPYAEKVELLSEKNESLTIAGTTGKWSEVQWNEKKGWVFGGFLGGSDPGAAEDTQIIAAAEKSFRESYKNSPAYLEDILKNGIRVNQKMDKYALLETGALGSQVRTLHLFAQYAGGWKEILTSGQDESVHLVHLNKDQLIDVVTISNGGGEDQTLIKFYLGKTDNSIEKIDHIYMHGVLNSSDGIFLDRCNEMQVNGTEAVGMKEVTITFDCETNSLKKTYK